MFERFTEAARQVVVLAQEEARRYNSPNIDSPHLLLGLIAEEDGISGRALKASGADLVTARMAVERLLPGDGATPTRGQIPFTPNAKEMLEGTLREALALGHNHIGTEHLGLAALVRDDGSCESVLGEIGVAPDAVAKEIFRLMDLDEREIRAWLRMRVRLRADRISAVTREGPASEASEEAAALESALAQDPGEEDTGEAIEAIPTHQDRPATEDELGRGRLAEVLGERMRRVRGEDTEAPTSTRAERREKRRRDERSAAAAGSFLVHVHAPWGAGKSSLLNFLAADLRNRREVGGRDLAKRARSFFRLRRPRDPQLSRWIVVEFNGWEHQRLAPPWWWLLTAVLRSCRRELWRIDRRRWLGFWVRDLCWRIWNSRAAVITAAVIGIALLVGWRSDWFGIEVGSLTALQAILLTAGSAITLGTTLLGLAAGTGRWLAIGTAAGADRFLRRAHDPLSVYRRRFRWLVRSARYPVAVFVDDLDRCRPAYVVELLEGIQTLFVEEPVGYVIAADRSWLCQSFTEGYSEFEEMVGDLARPLGFLFLEKTFQISTEIPPMSDPERELFWSSLLHAGGEEIPDPGPARRPASDAFADVSTQGEVEERIDDLISSGADGEQVLAAAMRRLNAPEMQEQLEKLLAEFAPLLEANPRSMKRLMNAYGIERDRLLRDGRLLTRRERRQLVLLTILRLRWPLLAEHLRRRPADASYLQPGRKAPANHKFAPLFADEDLLSLFDGSVVEERLDGDLIGSFPPERRA